MLAQSGVRYFVIRGFRNHRATSAIARPTARLSQWRVYSAVAWIEVVMTVRMAIMAAKRARDKDPPPMGPWLGDETRGMRHKTWGKRGVRDDEEGADEGNDGVKVQG